MDNKLNPALIKKNGLRRRQKNVTNLFWNLIALVSIVSALFMFTGSALHSWRVAPKLYFHHFKDTTPQTRQINESLYGLYMYSFNGGSTLTSWHNAHRSTCVGANPIFGQLIGRCLESCAQHFRTRCSVYQNFYFWGMMNMIVIIISGCIALAGSGVIYFFGPSYLLLQIMWLGGSVFSLIIIGMWLYKTNEAFTQLNSEAFYPFPILGTAFYFAFTGVCLMFVCGMFTFFQGCYSDMREWQMKEQKLANKICLQTQYNEDMLGMNGGLYANPSNPNYAMYNNAPLKYPGPRGPNISSAPPNQAFGVQGARTPFSMASHPSGPPQQQVWTGNNYLSSQSPAPPTAFYYAPKYPPPSIPPSNLHKLPMQPQNYYLPPKYPPYY